MRFWIGFVIVGGALFWGVFSSERPAPTPAPPLAGPQLRGLFVGPTAGDDAVLLECLCSEIADEIEWDAMSDEPVLTTGVQMDLLRVRARNLFLRGESIGQRQPKVAAAVGDYLTKELGVSGGPLTPDQRAKWASAYRELARAAEYAAR